MINYCRLSYWKYAEICCLFHEDIVILSIEYYEILDFLFISSRVDFNFFGFQVDNEA